MGEGKLVHVINGGASRVDNAGTIVDALITIEELEGEISIVSPEGLRDLLTIVIVSTSLGGSCNV